MRKVRIHLNDAIEAVIQRPAEAIHVGAAQAAQSGAVHHVQPIVLRRETVGDFARAVGRLVVHHQHVQIGHVQSKQGLP